MFVEITGVKTLYTILASKSELEGIEGVKLDKTGMLEYLDTFKIIADHLGIEGKIISGYFTPQGLNLEVYNNE